MPVPAYGMTLEGVVAPTQSEIRAWLAESFKEIFGANASTVKTTSNGKLIDFATRIAVVFFEGGAGAANSSWFTGATGVSLEKILSLFAFPRIPAQSSVAELVVYGDDATVIGGGSLVAAEVTQTVFITGDPVVLGGQLGYVARITGALIGETYEAEVDGQVAQFVAVTDDPVEIAEGLRDAILANGQAVTVQVPPFPDPDGNGLIVIEDDGLGAFVLAVSATGDATIDSFLAKRVEAVSENTGPYEALAGTITVINTPITGWVGVTTTADADAGSNAESDAAYRARHREQLMGKGSASEQAIRDAVAEIDGVTYCAVRSNDDDVIDGEGLPPHSIRVTVLGGDDAAIAAMIAKKKAAGIKTYGNESEVVLDGEGLPKLIYFQRPTLKYIWIEVQLLAGEKYPLVGDPAGAIAASIALWGDANVSIGDDVERFAFGTPINVVPGVKGAVVTMNYTLDPGDPQPPLLDADLVMSSTDLAQFDTSRITVGL